MEKLIKKYSDKLYAHGLTEKDAAIIGTIDSQVIWSRKDKLNKELSKIFEGMNINSLLYSSPKEPYNTIINHLLTKSNDVIYPKDCETRTFIHDLPICREFDINKIIQILKRRKSVIIKDYGIITFGTVSPEQAFVVFSSVCFSCFVKFFIDYLYDKKQNKTTKEDDVIFKKVISHLWDIPKDFKELKKSPFKNEEDIYSAIIEAGKLTVDYKLVDSFFGNISYKFGDTIYISQTSSSLDELSGYIDPCPIDNSSTGGITASSEYSSHKQVYLTTDNKAILHGHPKFSVIMSMYCIKENCELINECHIKCPDKRYLGNTPIVPGEVGTGKYGLCNTMPPALRDNKGVIVYGHGVFTVAKHDFNEAFKSLFEIENFARDEYFRLIKEL